MSKIAFESTGVNFYHVSIIKENWQSLHGFWGDGKDDCPFTNAVIKSISFISL